MLSGVINLNKPKGKTSHDMIYFMRRMSGQKRVGHTGTLDPDATGVLPVCLGMATKASDYIAGGIKEYRAYIHFGKVTNTQDISGSVIKECEDIGFSKDELLEVLNQFTGEIKQTPPMYSAIKINGQKLYELARKGIEIERRERNITVYDIKAEKIDIQEKYAIIDVTCSKGTYIRTLCHDIGEALGCGACMGALTRMRSGNFLLEKSYDIEEVEKLASQGRLSEIVIPVDSLFEDYVSLVVKGKNEFKIRNGTPLENMDYDEGTKVRIYDAEGNFLCISQMLEGKLKMLTSFWNS